MNRNALNRFTGIEKSHHKIISINIRSLRSHFKDLISEPKIQNSDVILIQQTCLAIDEDTKKFEIGNYGNHFNSVGNGKGLALYFRSNFKPVLDIKKDAYQMSKLESEEYDVISVYRSTDSNKRNQERFFADLKAMVDKNKITFVLGDFNINWINCEASIKESEFLKCGFIQLVKEPAHNQGGIIDHCYISKNVIPSSVLLRQSSVYYTDHDILEVEYTNID